MPTDLAGALAGVTVNLDNTASVGAVKGRNLTEAAAGGGLAQTAGRRYRMRIMEIQGNGPDAGRWGSSGFYPAAVQERDLPLIFGPTGGSQKVFLDHPGITENADRPERSVRDLAARITSTPVREADGMYADVEVYPHMAPVIEALWPDIGVSIRAAGLVEMGEAQGRQGAIVTELTAGFSVDFVTAAGAGGKVTQLLESARETVPVELVESGSIGAWVESRLHLALTALGDDMYGGGRLTRDERIALSSAVGDALDAFTTRLEADAPALYLRDQWGDPPTTPAGADQWSDPTPDLPVSEADPPREPTRLPVPPTAQAPAANPRRPGRAQLLEAIRIAAVRDLPPSKIRHLSRAELARLAESSEPAEPAPEPTPAGEPPAPDPGASGPDPAGTPPAADNSQPTEEPVTDPAGAQPDEAGRTSQATAPPATPVAEAAAQAAVTEADRRIAETEARLSAGLARLAEAEARTQRRYAELTARSRATDALAEADLPQVARAAVVVRVVAGLQLTEAGDLNETALAEAITAERDREIGYIASLDEARGVGRPAGLGQSAAPAPAGEGLSEADLEAHLAGVFSHVGMNESTAALAAKGR